MTKDTVVLDIDGVLADYRLGLLYWIRQSVPELAQAANAHIMRTDTWINADTMGVSYRKWLETLEMFRMSGGKQSIPLFEGAAEFVSWIDRRNWQLVLVTSRPIDIYSNIYRDTVEWLRHNCLGDRLLLWSKSKAEILFRLRMIDRIRFAVDDEHGHVMDYAALEVKTYWLNHYNVVMGILNHVTEVKNLVEIVKHEQS